MKRHLSLFLYACFENAILKSTGYGYGAIFVDRQYKSDVKTVLRVKMTRINSLDMSGK